MQALTASGRLGEDESSVMVGCSGFGGVAVQLTDDLSGTVTFEGTVDGINYAPINMTAIGTTDVVTTATSTGIWQGVCVGLLAFRARCSTYSSGIATVLIRVSEMG